MRTLRINALLLLTVCCFWQVAEAQISSGNGFTKGNRIELGVSPCGGYNSSVVPPSGYHENASNGKLGLIADPFGDGWTTGTPAIHGEYFNTGTPVEGFGLKFNGTNYINNATGSGCSPTQFLVL